MCHQRSAPTAAEPEEKFYLFRGDVGLPIGLIPLSPLARTLLAHGSRVKTAITACCHFVKAKLLDDLDLSALRGELGIYARFNHHDNPFVSTTDDFARALFYATSGWKDWTRGYVTVADVTPARWIKYADIIGRAYKQSDREYGVGGALLANEIRAQIPVSAMATLMRQLKNGGQHYGQAVRSLLSGRWAFKPVSFFGLRCPGCFKRLYAHLSEYLGHDQHKLAIHPCTSRGHRFHHVLVNAGPPASIVRCCRCGIYVHNTERTREQPLFVTPIWRRGKLFVEIENRSNENIDAVSLVFVSQEASDLDRYIQVDFRSFYDLVNNRNDYGRTASWDRALPPSGKTLEGPFLKGNDPALVTDVKAEWVHFEGGRNWIAPECFDR